MPKPKNKQDATRTRRNRRPGGFDNTKGKSGAMKRGPINGGSKKTPSPNQTKPTPNRTNITVVPAPQVTTTTTGGGSGGPHGNAYGYHGTAPGGGGGGGAGHDPNRVQPGSGGHGRPKMARPRKLRKAR